MGNIILLGTCIYHIIAGLACLGPQSWIILFGKKTYSIMYPDQFGPEYTMCLKAIGLFALTLSAFCLRAYLGDDVEFKAFTLQVLAALFLARALFRILGRDLFFKAYQITFKRSLKNIIFNIVLASVTLYYSFSMN